MLPPAWIVEKEAWKRLTPAFQHANQRAALQMWHYTFIRYESEADTVQRGLCDQDFIVDNQWARYCNREAVLALLKFPSVQPGVAVPEIDASMSQQIARRLRLAMQLEVTGRADDRRPVIRRHAHRDHVFFDVLAEVDACVESRRDDIHAAVIGGDVEHD